MMGRALIAVVGVIALAGVARADDGAFDPPTLSRLGRVHPARQQFASFADRFGSVLNEHLGLLTNEVLSLAIDGRHKRGLLRVRGAASGIAVGLESDVTWRRGGAHVQMHIDLRLGTHAVRFDVPEFEIRRTAIKRWHGALYGVERGFEIRVPLLVGTF